MYHPSSQSLYVSARNVNSDPHAGTSALPTEPSARSLLLVILISVGRYWVEGETGREMGSIVKAHVIEWP